MTGQPDSATFAWQFLPHFVLRSPGFPFSLLERFRLRSTLEILSGTETAARRMFEEETALARTALIEIAESEVFREAIFLSSPDFYANNLGKYLRAAREGRFNSDIRRIERRLFAYLQRFTAKNETTSVFGPLNYGSIDRDPGDPRHIRISYAPGSLIQDRAVFLTYWVVKALVEAIAADPRLAEDLPVRLRPAIELLPPNRLALHHLRKQVTLPVSVISVLRSLGRGRSLREIAENHGEAVAEIFARALPALQAACIADRGLPVSSSRLHLLDRLIEDVAALPESASRQAWLGRLEEWRLWCRDFARSGLAARIGLLKDGEDRFHAQTGCAPRRGQGQMYSDRLICYEEARGNVAELALTAAGHDALRAKMRGALELAAAQGWHEWRHLRALGKALYLTLSPDQAPVRYLDFIEAARRHFTEMPPAPVSPAVQALTELVRRRLAAGATGPLDLATAELDLPDLPGAFYGLPDVFLHSRSETALEAGDFTVFLGKMHHHLLTPGWLTTFRPDEDRLRADLDSVLAGPGFRGLTALEVMRRNKGFYDFPGARIEYGEIAEAKGDREILPIHSLDVTLDGSGELCLSGRDRQPRMLYLTLTDHLHYPPFALFTPPWLGQITVGIGDHTPRLSIDGVVIQRARWTLAPDEVMATRSADAFSGFLAFNRWRDHLGLPSQIYVKGRDRKPIFVDFAIPHCHSLLLELAENAERLTAEEMFPAPDGLWLNTARGGFTCELRMNVFRVEHPRRQERTQNG